MRYPTSQAVEKEVKKWYPVSTEIHKNVSSNKTYTFNMWLQLKAQKKYKVKPGMHVRRKSMFLWLIVPSDENLK